MSNEVNFQVAHFHGVEHPGVEEGFYYSIPTEEEEAPHWAGPYPTHDDARQAAVAFIKDALSDFKTARQLEELSNDLA